jgi:DNA mismatch endonuclease (patch repair protein)
LPATNYEFWKEKLEKNKERDKSDILRLQDMGWKVVIVWQCELKNSIVRNKRLIKLINEITCTVNAPL